MNQKDRRERINFGFKRRGIILSIDSIFRRKIGHALYASFLDLTEYLQVIPDHTGLRVSPSTSKFASLEESIRNELNLEEILWLL